MTTKIPVELSSTPSIVDNGDATAITIDSSEEVGIGSTSPSAKLEVAGSSNSTYLKVGGDDASNARGLTFTSSASANFNGAVHTINAPSSQGVIALATYSSERMRIDSSGNVGIGMTPFTGYTGYSLQIGGTSQTFISIHNNTTGNTVNDGFSLGNDASNVYLTNRENTPMIFSTNNTERMRIDSSGKILFNTTSTLDANTLLHVGGINNNFNGMVFRNSSDVSTIFPIFFQNASGTLVGSINNNGSSTTFSGTSDYRLKENIQPMEKGLERVKKLKPVKFDWKETGESSEGFIAHEIQEAGWNLGVVGEKDGKEMQEVEYGKLTPLLVKAIQEQQTIIEDLQTQINEVKNGN